MFWKWTVIWELNMNSWYCHSFQSNNLNLYWNVSNQIFFSSLIYLESFEDMLPPSNLFLVADSKVLTKFWISKYQNASYKRSGVAEEIHSINEKPVSAWMLPKLIQFNSCPIWRSYRYTYCFSQIDTCLYCRLRWCRWIWFFRFWFLLQIRDFELFS